MNRVINKLMITVKKSEDYFLYVFATVMHSGFHFIFSIYVKAYVNPLEYGIYSSCLLLQTYLTYLQLGSLNAFNRDYPQLMGAGKKEEAKAYSNTTFTFLLYAFSSALIVILIVLFVLFKTSNADSRYLGGLALCAVITGLTIIENFGASKTRVEGKFKYVSIVTILEMISLIIGVLLIPQIGYYGIYITTILGMIIGIGLYWKTAYKPVKLEIDKGLLKTILISGLPLLVNGLIWTLVNSIDKFVILGFINTEALGLYAIAQNAFSYMVLIPTALSQLFYVKMGKAYGEKQDVAVLASTGIRFTAILAVLMSFLSVTAYFFSPVLVEKLMPNYKDGITAAQILILGLTVYSPTLVNGNILTILKKNSAIVRGSLYLCVLNAVCSTFYVVVFGPQIECVALGTVTAYIGRTAIIIYQLKRYAGCKVMDLMKCSVIPVLIVLGVSITFYAVIDNKLLGFTACILAIVLFYSALYRENIIRFVKGGK